MIIVMSMFPEKDSITHTTHMHQEKGEQALDVVEALQREERRDRKSVV